MGVHGDPTPHPHHPVPAPGVPFALGALGPLPGDARDTGFLGDTRSSPLPGRRLPGRDKGPSVPGRGVARPALWAVRADGELEPRGPDGSVETPALGAMGTLRKPPGDGACRPQFPPARRDGGCGAGGRTPGRWGLRWLPAVRRSRVPSASPQPAPASVSPARRLAPGHSQPLPRNPRGLTMGRAVPRRRAPASAQALGGSRVQLLPPTAPR